MIIKLKWIYLLMIKKYFNNNTANVNNLDNNTDSVHERIIRMLF